MKVQRVRPEVFLCGELNPYGSDPAMALYPLPRGASGDRLRGILGLTTGAYLRAFDRANLCSARWSMPEARREALRLWGFGYRVVVLLGAKVARAWGQEFVPFSVQPAARPGQPMVVILPHPSGRNLVWSSPIAVESARNVVRAAGALPESWKGRA